MEFTAIIFVVLVGILVMTGVRIVPQGYNYTIERLGVLPASCTRGLIF